MLGLGGSNNKASSFITVSIVIDTASLNSSSPGMLSRSLRRTDPLPDLPTSSAMQNVHSEEDDTGLFTKFGTSPAPHMFSHAMRIPNGFGSGPSSFPAGSIGGTYASSYQAGSVPSYVNQENLSGSVPVATSALRQPAGGSPPDPSFNTSSIPSIAVTRSGGRKSIEERWPADLEDQKEPLLQTPSVIKTQVTLQATAAKEEKDGGALRALVFGGINGLVGLPALIAFATIVFQSPLYSPYIGSLCKFFFFSSAVQQTVFCLFSTLPFAVGQVQDVGLIFLSAMSTDIANLSLEAKLSAKEALGTALFTFCIATFTVGVLTMLVGKYRMAQLVQYMPLPVIGGYLGYVGYFCVAGGTSLAAGVELNKVSQWLDVLHFDPLTKLAPLIATTAVLVVTLEHFSHPLVLPSVLAAVPLLFHIVLLVAGVSLSQAQDAGWAMKPTTGSPYFWDLWGMFNLNFERGWSGILDGIYWPAFFSQLPKVTGLFLVVCFGSCMDVAAIQQEIPRPLDFNGELITVGISNIVTSMLGAGFTGSYIFSQTIFTLRAGVLNRLNGWTVVFMEFAVFLAPVSVVQYCPSFFFGALLVWFGVDILANWLVFSYWKLSRPEYILLWCTFVAIMYSGLEAGIGAGIVMATLYFAYEYAQSTVSTLNPVPATSGAMHSYSHRAVLEALMPHRVAALALSGFAFFGNSIAISKRVEKISDDLLLKAQEEAAEALVLSQGINAPDQAVHVPMEDDSLPPQVGSPNSSRGSMIMRINSQRFQAKHVVKKTVESLTDAPLFMILDFKLVPSMDATAARTFATLTNSLFSRGIQLIISGIPTSRSEAIRGLLTAQGLSLVHPEAHLYSDVSVSAGEGSRTLPDVPSTHSLLEGATEDELTTAVLQPGQAWEFPSLQAAARFCEEQFLSLAVSRGLLEPARTMVSLEEVIEAHASQLPSSQVSNVVPYAVAIKRHMKQHLLSRGQGLFSAGDAMDSLYIVESGRLQLESSCSSQHAASGASLQQRLAVAGSHVTDYGPGCMVGVHGFYLARPAGGSARCRSATCRVMELPRAAFQKLLVEAPAALSVLQLVIARSLSLDLVSSLELLDGMEAQSAASS
ncbi:hypothetical protein CEUSTIGMA_g8181.t1 [Chlamydomonas eustigma]|uniref:STAS domain-containing protein n=1 Tax=Chlamydomonas eustigma TaxID=1157962 RepID=A0A250XCG4_9CHLO|nr:hypothetical protein CEUSTIGMA_g8181.t1 [Chlamydomonas eustigma]|eukprot:GAX80746.1 hypothetical protein CEUSTIGMA_g8181.t1 [Chlamydomonas eustigma]